MGIRINMGVWNGVFAVPCDVVDKFLKTTAHQQLKILLFLLRHSDRDFSVDELANEFNMHPIDVKDCITYWVNEGLLAENNCEYIPVENKNASQNSDDIPEIKPVQNITNNTDEAQTKKVRPLSRQQKPDMLYVSARLRESGELSYLMQEAEVILGRPLSNSDSATLVMLHDDDGLPVDVIIMILQYAKSEGKLAMRYIEKIGISWASEEVDTLEKAESKIKEIHNSRESWKKVSRIFGLKIAGTPTKAQLECSNRWLKQWRYSDEMIRLAYEICLDTKGEYNLKYIDGIIKRWREDAIQTKADYEAYLNNNSKKQSGTKKQSAGKSASYNLDDAKNDDLFDL